MSKLIKLFAILIMLAGATAVTADTASAQHRRGGGGHGNWQSSGNWNGHRGGGWGRGYGRGYYGGGPYYATPYYAEPACGYARVRVLRNGYWVLRRAWRCL